jgi:16S rRNA processing protein RimM
VESDKQHSFIVIARIARTRGNRGEVLADLYTDFPDRFDALEEVRVEFSDGRTQPVVIESNWEHKGRIVLKFAGIDSISAAQDYVGCWVAIPAEQAVKLPEDTYFDHDLVGCSVADLQGNKLGIVSEILRIAGNNQLVVKDSDREYMIPVVKSICVEIDIMKKRITVDLPEGLMDLN